MSRLAKVIAICVLGVGLGAQPAFAKGKKAKSGSTATAIGVATARGTGSTATATATCPPGMRVVGGGFNAPSTAQVVGLVHESVRTSPRSWRASAQLLGMGNGLTLTTYAYCEKNAPRAKRRRASLSTDGVPQLGPTATARCRRRENALSGGFKMSPPLIGQGVTALVLDSHRSGDGGWVTRVATGAAAPSTFTSEVYCARGVDPTERSATSPLNTTFFEVSTATASCAPSAERTGGFAQPLSQLSSFLFIYESRRADGGWRVSGLHSGSNPGVAVSALAYCG